MKNKFEPEIHYSKWEKLTVTLLIITLAYFLGQYFLR